MINNIFSIDSKTAVYDLSASILKHFGVKRPIVICLGSNKVLGDMAGVFVADILKSRGLETYVLGGSINPVNNNIVKLLSKSINTKNVLIVDCGILFQKRSVVFQDHITLNDGTRLNFPTIICGTIQKENRVVHLAKTNFSDVIKFSNIVANAICDFFCYVNILKKKCL